ncbi:hypothetical protein G9F72_018220 [Clostridium estertheticum]|uniref:hypothetical protein n=1 Tax=Clostridium estertheticum TaxID=238834 RepID=UPI0013E92BFD|nr:hypothetical protein [Clostridium estertheticum]MBZ9688271.1 hypothetical protein [Clostridium estertheticum]
MVDNKMQSYLGDNYTDNHIINFLNYWMCLKEPRTENDLDCLYLNGDLCADTIFSVWTPLKFVLDCLNPDEKFYKKDKYGPDPHRFLKKIKCNIDIYLPRNEKVVEEMYYFAKLAETRANVMRWPVQGINNKRYDDYDQMPPTLYNCFSNGKYGNYFDNDDLKVVDWSKKEKLEMFFFDDIISKETIKPLITSMKANEIKWLLNKDEIIEMLKKINIDLEERLRRL